MVASAVDRDDVDLIHNLISKDCDFEIGGNVHALAVVPIYYNPSTLKFEWGQRASIDIADLTVSMGDVEKLLANSYWKVKQYDYTSGSLDYAGFNTDISAADGDSGWYVFKYTWSGSNCTKIQGPATGTWTGRAALF